MRANPHRLDGPGRPDAHQNPVAEAVDLGKPNAGSGKLAENFSDICSNHFKQMVVIKELGSTTSVLIHIRLQT